ncbi:threonylcarbamoyl-AMP synthase [Olivibacter sp. SDN3]|uniref:L-threonylcarbamoyladenylate synthase n=1 Tax=Olivibacter sp. SDN3 TaxID=2764720 RepID=UPI001650FFA7|nr:L-threonylcarbamoyladenylate synthase [Olivibacter sp. SDN3]QNL47724.1 threonylcarbamoyl-AMP synthase [Olivibacter sp. SDN3]
MNEDLLKALQILRSGGIILYPTDTIWGIGCDATNPEAVEKIYQLKARQKDKSLIVLLESDYKLQSYVNDIPEVAYQLIECTDKPLTIVYSNAKNLAPNLLANDGSVGIRIVKHRFCEQLLQRFRKPIVSTSANISGDPPPKNFQEISQQIKNGVDYVVQYEQENIGPKQASTILKLDPSGAFTFIRK